MGLDKVFALLRGREGLRVVALGGWLQLIYGVEWPQHCLRNRIKLL